MHVAISNPGNKQKVDERHGNTVLDMIECLGGEQGQYVHCMSTINASTLAICGEHADIGEASGHTETARG